MAKPAVDLLLLSTALFAAALMWTENGKPFSAPWAWAFLAMLVIPAFAQLTFESLRSPWHDLRQMLYFVAAWLVFMMARERAATLYVSPHFSALLGAIAYLYVFYALLQAYDLRFLAGERLFPVWSTLTTRFPGPLMQPNWQGLFLAIVIVHLLHQSCLRYRERWTWSLATIIPFAGLFLTSSRSAAVVLVFGLLALLLISQQRKAFLIHAALPLSIGIGLALLINTTATAPLADTTLLSRLQSGATNDRLLIWNFCIQLILTHPWLGVGWGNLPAHAIDGTLAALSAHPSLSNAAGIGNGHAWAHNLLLQGWVEGGIVGLFAFLILLGAVVRQGYQLFHRKNPFVPSESIALLSAAMILLHGMVSVSIMQPFFMVLLALSFAAAFPQTKEGEQ